MCVFSGHTLLQFRRKMTPILPDSSSFVIPLQYTRDYHNNQRLLLHDSDDPLFRNSQAVPTWKSVSLVVGYSTQASISTQGTFSICPPHFDQLYIMHGIVHDT
ncbi:unnamed protein product, partial [Didymodactylos carnosus]